MRTERRNWWKEFTKRRTKKSYGSNVRLFLIVCVPISGVVVRAFALKAESAQQWGLEPNTLSVVSGVTTLMLANLPEKHSVAYIWA